jgi:regulator of cell morphogenesis and NO signaling
MMGRVVSAHGARHPELVMPMAATLGKLVAALDPHLVEEEDVLFPRLVALEMRARGGRANATDAGAAALLDAMVAEHDLVGGLLESLRAMTCGYVAPEDACGTFRGLMTGLAELEEEIHRHVHLENNVLVPAARLLL